MSHLICDLFIYGELSIKLHNYLFIHLFEVRISKIFILLDFVAPMAKFHRL